MKKHLENAKKFIDSGQADDLIHASLELRLAIEKHVYEKLNFYSKRHGTKLLFKSWQPDKALKMLSQLEPRSDQSYVVAFAEEDREGNHKKEFRTLGNHEALSVKWTRKNYNKLGSYLHLQHSNAEKSSICKSDLLPIYEELQRVESSNLIANFAETIYFNCQICESKITTCVDALPHLDLIYCSNNSCNATFFAELKEDDWHFIINAVDFECQECGNKQLILANELKIGARLTCCKCKERFVVAQQNFGLKKYRS